MIKQCRKCPNRGKIFTLYQSAHDNMVLYFIVACATNKEVYVSEEKI